MATIGQPITIEEEMISSNIFSWSNSSGSGSGSIVDSRFILPTSDATIAKGVPGLMDLTFSVGHITPQDHNTAKGGRKSGGREVLVPERPVFAAYIPTAQLRVEGWVR